MSTLLSPEQIDLSLSKLSGWTLEGSTIKTTRVFKDFIEAIDFVNKLVAPAEAAGHHPDISISYNRVTVSLTTHDAGGITQKDLDMAQTVAELS